jgi:hypothetical protein
MKFNIKVIYDSGDSFRKYPDQETIVPLEVTDIELAKKALKAIKEHYLLYSANHNRGKFYSHYDPKVEKERKEVVESSKLKEWYCEKYTDFSIKFDIGNGKIYQCHCNWTGYFETLKSAEIVRICEEHELEKIEFD